MAMTAAFLGGIVVAGVGVAFAQQDGTSTTTVPPAAKEAPAPSGAKAVPPGGKVKPDGRGAGPLGKLGRGPLDGLAKFGFGPLGALHGEFVAPDGNDGFRTIAMQRGEVTAVSPTAITVKSDDGFSKKYAVDENTIVNSGRDGIGTVKNGDTVMVTALVDGGTAKAMRVVDRTSLGSIRDHWFPPKKTG